MTNQSRLGFHGRRVLKRQAPKQKVQTEGGSMCFWTLKHGDIQNENLKMSIKLHLEEQPLAFLHSYYLSHLSTFVSRCTSLTARGCAARGPRCAVMSSTPRPGSWKRPSPSGSSEEGEFCIHHQLRSENGENCESELVRPKMTSSNVLFCQDIFR